MERYDALVVHSGGIEGESELRPWTRKRVDKALELKDSADYVIFSTGNGSHAIPYLDSEGFPITEARAMSNYFLKNSGRKEKVLLEEISRDTIGNAYFTRIMHTDVMRLKRLGIITSKWHMPRTREIFKFLYQLPPLPFEYDLNFLEIEDEGIDERVLKKRMEEEAKSLNRFVANMNGIGTLEEFTNGSSENTKLMPRD